MFKIKHNGVIIDSFNRVMVIPLQGDKLVIGNLLYIVQTVDLDMGQVIPEQDDAQPFDGVLSVTIGVIKESEQNP